MQHARDAGLDLVEVDSNSSPPVCRILDYGKFKYEQAKKEREGRKHQKGTMIHEVRLRPRTGQHDINLKVRIANRLLAEGDKVKLSVMFRGREMSHPEVGQEVLDKALVGVGDMAIVEKPPGMEGRFLTVILTPNPKRLGPAPGAKAGGAEPGASGARPPKAGGGPDGATAEAEPPTGTAANENASDKPAPEAADDATNGAAPAAEVTVATAAAEGNEETVG
jgi:translation initiation factor IF-3